MGFTYFVILVIFVLIAYYVWVIKQEASPKPTLASEDTEEEVEYDFNEPIRVSEEYITGGKMDVTRQISDTSDIHVKGKPSLSQDEVEFMHLIDYSKAKQYGKELASFVQDVLSPTVSSLASSEVEFFHLTNLQDHIQAGRQMFSEIQLA